MTVQACAVLRCLVNIRMLADVKSALMITLEEERVCTECAWEANGADRTADGPKGTKAASSEASASLGALVGMDASLRAASVTLMYSRGQPSRLCLL